MLSYWFRLCLCFLFTLFRNTCFSFCLYAFLKQNNHGVYYWVIWSLGSVWQSCCKGQQLWTTRRGDLLRCRQIWYTFMDGLHHFMFKHIVWKKVFLPQSLASNALKLCSFPSVGFVRTSPTDTNPVCIWSLNFEAYAPSTNGRLAQQDVHWILSMTIRTCFLLIMIGRTWLAFARDLGIKHMYIHNHVA